MTMRARLDGEYKEMRFACALVTAADAKYAPFLFNALSSIHINFPDHPLIYVFDLGLSRAQKLELDNVSWVRVKPINKFVPHWKAGWSWKPYILTQVEEQYVMYFDAANIVLYRSIALWFLAIKRHGFFGIGNGYFMHEITPSDYWDMFGLDPIVCGAKPIFGAGLFGFDRASPASQALQKCLSLTVAGWTLGRSASEQNPLYGKVPLRDCTLFRADQTLFNLAFLECFGANLLIRDETRYCGRGGAHDHPSQYLWYTRRNKYSLLYFNKPLNGYSIIFLVNRLTDWFMVMLRSQVRKLLNWPKGFKK
jgi:hypothetical protein